MNENKIKYKYNSIILNIVENIKKQDKNYFMNFLLHKEKFLLMKKYFKIYNSKFLLLIQILLIILIKLNLVSSQLINNKRNIMSQSSSIKLKIENSGNQKIYSNGIYEWCNPVTFPD